jgi:excisionase family DNA binding protein
MARIVTRRPAQPERLLTVSEYAQVRGCSEKTVRRRIAEGKLPIIRTGRLVRIHPKYAHLDL